MGKATRWLKGLLGKIRSSDPSRSPSASHRPAKERKRWSLLKSNSPPSNPTFRRAGASSASALRFHSPPAPVPPKNEPNEHAIAVAAASAAAAEAAVAAAQAAANVVRLTSSGRCYPDPPAHASFGTVLEAWAVLVIQSHFRGYLARRALRALKGLVKLQALVRGHILRKKTAETMRSIQAMLRAQERARSIRAYESPNSSEKSSQTYQRGPPTPEKFEQISYNRNTKSTQSAMPKVSGSRTVNRVIIPTDQRYLNSGWSESQLDEPMWAARGRYLHYRMGASLGGEDNYIRPDKTLEIDARKPTCLGPKRRKNMFESIGLDFASDQLTHSFTTTSKEDPTAHTLKRSAQDEDEEVAFCTAENSPQCYSSMSRGGLSSRKQSPMTPTKSDASASSCVSSYSDCPSYMAYTESSRAKMRSLSAPRQRLQGPQQQCQEKAGLTKRWSVHQQRAASSSASSAAMQACIPTKAYAGSDRLDRVGVPVRNNATVYYSGCLE